MASFDKNNFYVSDSEEETSLNDGILAEYDDDKIVTQNTFSKRESDGDSDDPGFLDCDFLNLDVTQPDFNVDPFHDITTIPNTLTPQISDCSERIQNENGSDVQESPKVTDNLAENAPDQLGKPRDSSPIIPSALDKGKKHLTSDKLILPHAPANIVDHSLNSGSSSDDEILLSAVLKTDRLSKNKKSVCNPDYNDPVDPDTVDFKDNPPCPFASGGRNGQGVCEPSTSKEQHQSCQSLPEEGEPNNLKSDNNKARVRFHKSTVEEVESLQMDAKAEKTHKQTKWGITILQEWCTFSGFDPAIEKLTPGELGPLLKQFYAEVRQKDGTSYSRASLLCLRAAINRYLIGPPHNLSVNIMADGDFTGANAIITGTIRNLKKKGEDVSVRHPPITPADLKLMYSSRALSNDSPRQLQNKIFFELALHFGRRGREGYRDLKKSDIVYRKDANGEDFATLRFNPYEKNHHAVDHHESNHEQKMYSTKNADCPVESLKFYISHLSKDSDVFFQKPKVKGFKDCPTWYHPYPLGVNTIGSFMSRISTEASLSRRYTNHCIRASTITLLRGAKVQALDIVSVTGHRSIQSIDSYSKVDDDQRQHMSLKLSKAIGKKVNLPQEKKSPERNPLGTPPKHARNDEKINDEPPNVPSTTSEVKDKISKVGVVQPSPRKVSTRNKTHPLPISPLRSSPRLQEKYKLQQSASKTSKKLIYPDDHPSQKDPDPSETSSSTTNKGQTIIIQAGSVINIHYH